MGLPASCRTSTRKLLLPALQLPVSCPLQACVCFPVFFCVIGVCFCTYIGILIPFLRMFTDAVYSRDATGLQKSANLYFSVGIVVMPICTVLYNVAHKLPVIKYYSELEAVAVTEDEQVHESTGSVRWQVFVERMKWYGVGQVFPYIVALSGYPGCITEHALISSHLQYWLGILFLIHFNLLSLFTENQRLAVGSCICSKFSVLFTLNCLPK